MKLQRIEAPTDGTPFWIFHDSREVLSPNRKTAAYFHHLSQMPHGDSYFQLLFAKRVFPGFIWERLLFGRRARGSLQLLGRVFLTCRKQGTAC